MGFRRILHRICVLRGCLDDCQHGRTNISFRGKFCRSAELTTVHLPDPPLDSVHSTYLSGSREDNIATWSKVWRARSFGAKQNRASFLDEYFVRAAVMTTERPDNIDRSARQVLDEWGVHEVINHLTNFHTNRHA